MNHKLLQWLCLYLLLGSTSAVPSDGELYALRDFYLSTDGFGWKDSDGWDPESLKDDPSTNPCGWYGVGCSADESTVNSITLSGNRLAGSLPRSLGNLTNLVTLQLSANNLTETIPHGLFEGASGLVTLDLGSNNIIGSIPTQIGRVTALQSLSLSKNYLGGSIPPQMASLTALTHLGASSNSLTGRMPHHAFSNWSSLTVLTLSNNKLEGTIDSNLCHMHNLEELELGYNLLSGGIPPCLTNLTSLVTLSLPQSNLHGNP